MKRVLLIDPAANGKKIGSSSYNNGLVDALSSQCELTLAATVNYEKCERNIRVIKCFFPFSNTMKRGIFRTTVRLFEYTAAYIFITYKVFKNRYDVIHIQWLLCYPIDIIFLKILKKRVGKIVYTAHNVLPHVDGEKKIKRLRKIYGISDVILVHGEAIKKEFERFFPEFIDKVFIQYHGEYYQLSTTYDKSKIDSDLISKISEYKLVFLFSGNIFYNKGLDRLVKIWLKEFYNEPVLLIITGEQSVQYKEYDILKNQVDNCPNIIRFKDFVDTNTFNFLASSSDVMVLPYRHASMSAVIFTAACFNKLVLTTNVGAIPEYLENNIDSIICESDDDSISSAMKKIINNLDKSRISKMGETLGENIQRKYSWENIASYLTSYIY